MSRESGPLQEFFIKLGENFPGVRCTWTDEFVGGESAASNLTIFFGKIASDRLNYNTYPGDEEFKYHRKFDWFEPYEELVSFSIKRALVGPVVLIHTRLFE